MSGMFFSFHGGQRLDQRFKVDVVHVLEEISSHLRLQ